MPGLIYVVSCSVHSFPALCLSTNKLFLIFSVIAILIKVRWDHNVVLISWMAGGIEDAFHVFAWPFVYDLSGSVCSFHCSFTDWVDFLLLNF